MNRKRIVIRCEKSDTERPPEARSQGGEHETHNFIERDIQSWGRLEGLLNQPSLESHRERVANRITWPVSSDWARASKFYRHGRDWRKLVTWPSSWLDVSIHVMQFALSLWDSKEGGTASWLERTESGEKGGVKRLISARHYMGESYTYVLREGWCLRGDHAVKLR